MKKTYSLLALKNTHIPNELKRSSEIVDNLVQNTMENFCSELVENQWRCNEFLKQTTSFVFPTVFFTQTRYKFYRGLKIPHTQYGPAVPDSTRDRCSQFTIHGSFLPIQRESGDTLLWYKSLEEKVQRLLSDLSLMYFSFYYRLLH